MAKKSARKEITKINLKQAALEGLSYERACETAKRAGKPSYRFTVGDKVQVGHLLNCVVDEALEGGYMYLIRSGANSDNYSCWAWTNVRPLDDDKDTHFAKRNSGLQDVLHSNVLYWRSWSCRSWQLSVTARRTDTDRFLVHA